MGKSDGIEILFVAGSSKDRRGRRVLIREGMTENCLWPGDEITEFDMRVLGVSVQEHRRIKRLLSSGSADAQTT